ncbi:MAG: DEAD/DEAH box helicase family protein, partial [Burkholderiaceae bacterium]|nr:DEAD/DEAH box helicase family protein [Burkholderiaceae bacterium]
MSDLKNAVRYAQVILDIPLALPLDYSLAGLDAGRAQVGHRCVVPLGRGVRVGVIVGTSDAVAIDAQRIKPVSRVLDEITPLAPDWLQLTQFAADYYQHSWGEVALPSLPRMLRSVPGARFAQSIARMRTRAGARWSESAAPRVELTAEQTAAIDAVTRTTGFASHLLFGITGSGKTEVYLAAIANALKSSPTAQALLLVPEINLTPQLESLLQARFPNERVLALHSNLPDAERAAAW